MMCLCVWNSLSEAPLSYSSLKLFFVILDEIGFVNCTSLAIRPQKRRGPSSECSVPFVLMNDLLEDS